MQYTDTCICVCAISRHIGVYTCKCFHVCLDAHASLPHIYIRYATYIHTYMHAYMHTYIHTYIECNVVYITCICTYTSQRLYSWVCTHIYVYIYIYLFIFIFIFVYVYIYIYV